jgi:hypothetical protein
MADGLAIVRKAYNQLKSSLTSDDCRVFSDSTLEDVWRAVREIEREHAARGALKYMRRIEPMLRCLESYASVIDTFCQGYPFMAFIWVEIPLPMILMRGS